MRVLKILLFASVGILIIGTVGFTFWLRDHYVVPILTYHHVGISSGSGDRLNTVSVKSFKYQMSFLKRHGFQVISFDDFIEGFKTDHFFGHNTVVLQFDDGYEDNYTYAFPILKRYGFHAQVFLISDVVGCPGFLTWNQIKEMEKYNFMAGAHTRHHIYLPNADQVKAQDEIAGSKRLIENHLGHKIDYFAYPYGGFSERIKRLVKKAGYRAAVTTNCGDTPFNQDLYELKRIHMNNGDDRYSGLILWAKLSGYYNLFRQPKTNGLNN
jgi:peptidoglycan/xylan/chitin deacetylase (PgdA/CDA1 family)